MQPSQQVSGQAIPSRFQSLLLHLKDRIQSKPSLILFGVLLAIVSTFIVYAFYANHPQPDTDPDTFSFLTPAYRFMDTGQITDPIRPPAYPLFLAAIFFVAGRDNLFAVSVVQGILFVITVMEIYLLTYVILRQPWIAAITGFFVVYNIYILGFIKPIIVEGLALWLTVTLALIVVFAIRSPRPRSIWLIAGVTFVLLMTRPEWLYAPIPLLAYVLFIAARKGMFRKLIVHAIAAVVVCYMLVGVYGFANGVQNGYFGLSEIQNVNLFGKIMQYHMQNEADPKANPRNATISARLTQFLQQGGVDPYVFNGIYPEYNADHFSVMGNYATAIVIHHPIEFISKTIPLIFQPITQPYYLSQIRFHARYTPSLVRMFFDSNNLYKFFNSFLWFALLWLVLLVYRRTSRIPAVEMMGAIVIIALFELGIVAVGTYGDYTRLHVPVSALFTVVIWGTLLMLPQLIVINPSLAFIKSRDQLSLPPKVNEDDDLAPTLPRVAVISATKSRFPGYQPVPMRRDGAKNVVIMGAGPAGLTAAFELVMRHGIPIVVLEKDATYVGGISRTVEHAGYRFDIGGHRFFSKSQEIEDLWSEVLGDELLVRPRLSRIFYRGKYFDYPLKAANALFNLGPIETIRCMASYGLARLHPTENPQTFEDWVTNQFGKRLFTIFFKTYTEKVWGISTNELSADWAAQRIKGLNMAEAIKNAFLPPKQGHSGDAVIKTLIEEFRYPRLGPGEMWERVQYLLAEREQPVVLGQEVVAIHHDGRQVTGVEVQDTQGVRRIVSGTHYISTLPIRELVEKCHPPLPDAVNAAAQGLKYRDFLTVAIIVDKAEIFPDNWIYLHDAGIIAGRIQNFKNWSPAMVADQRKTCLGLEYFCFEGDGLWTSSDADLVQLGTQELMKLKMSQPKEVLGGFVVRQPKAYPVYDDVYKQHLAVIRHYFEAQLGNLQLVGRNGMHHYNNQDHSMMTALVAARNIAVNAGLDAWNVNTDAEYHEENRPEDEDRSGRLVPMRVPN